MPLNPAPLTHASPAAVSPLTRYRWWIVVLLFFATTINYIDRTLFSQLIPYFEDELRIGPMDLAYINVAFVLAYGLGMTLVGRFVDRVGVRVGLAITFLVWNVASVGHALVFSVAGFILIRILLGLGEAGNFPSSIKAIAEWFPKRERALATGWFNCGSNVAQVVTPLLVPVIVLNFGGWRACFASLGGVGLIWLVFWLRVYRSPDQQPKVSPEELAHIRSDPPDSVGRIPLLTLLGYRQVYGTSLARFFTEAPWWFYLTWMPKFLADRFSLSDYQRGWALATIFLVADVGAVGGGWISSSLLKRGYSTNAARKIALLIAALGTLPIVSVAWLEGGSTVFGIPPVWIAVPIVALAAACHQAWSSNIYTIISDTLPRSAVATTVGINMAFGSVGSAMFQLMIGLQLAKSGSYSVPFLVAGALYLVGLLALHLVQPRLNPAAIDERAPTRLRWWHLAAGASIIAAAIFTLQVQLNKPKYANIASYYERRAIELHASAHAEGPAAKVGWQDARWTRWQLADGTSKWDLVKFDRYGTPFLEPKGAAAKKYVGPTAKDVEAFGTLP